MGRAFWLRAAAAGVVAGGVDIFAAALINHVGIEVILRAIARGLIGKGAMTGGAATATLGFVLQLAMGAVIALIYAAASLRLSDLQRRWAPWGLAYGVGVFFVMEFVVVPLSAVRRIPHFTPLSFAENMAAMLLFGLICAYGVARGVRRRGLRRG